MSQEMDQNEAEALRAHGEKVANKARHLVGGPKINSAEYTPRDIVAAMYYMHRQTLADVARELNARLNVDEGDVVQQISDVLHDMTQSSKQANNTFDGNDNSGEGES